VNTLRKLQHENVLSFSGCSLKPLPAEIFFVECDSKTTLGDILAERIQEMDFTIDIMQGILQGLNFLHRNGVILGKLKRETNG